MNGIPDSFWAYLAGFIDARGSLMLNRLRCRKSYAWVAEIRISHRNRDVLETLRRIVRIGFIAKSGIGGYQLRIGGGQAKALVGEVLRFSIIRKKELVWVYRALETLEERRKDPQKASSTDETLKMLASKLGTIREKRSKT